MSALVKEMLSRRAMQASTVSLTWGHVPPSAAGFCRHPCKIRNRSSYEEGYVSYSAAGSLDEITVEYAPYGSDDFRPLTYEALDFDGNRSPNWGTTLGCALSQVDRTSASGWFDVRVSLKSATGSSVNLVSPAFRISEFAGIERISDDTEATEGPAEYFTLDGRRVSAPEPGSIVLCSRAGAVTKLIVR